MGVAQDRGRAGEALAAAYLELMGSRLVARNVRQGGVEVDLQDSPFDDHGKLVYDTNLGLHHVAKTFINTQSQGELQIQAGLCIPPLQEYPDIQVREFVFIAARLKSIDLEIYKVHRLGQSSLKFTGDIIVATVHSLILLAGSI